MDTMSTARKHIQDLHCGYHSSNEPSLILNEKVSAFFVVILSGSSHLDYKLWPDHNAKRKKQTSAGKQHHLYGIEVEVWQESVILEKQIPYRSNNRRPS